MQPSIILDIIKDETDEDYFNQIYNMSKKLAQENI